MSTKDINLFEGGSGGEMRILNSDLLMAETIYQTIYLALYGGNVEQSTTSEETDLEESFDYWGNQLFYSNNPDKWFNSQTERTLSTVPLNGEGRKLIEDAVNADLQFLNNVVNFEVEVSISSNNRAEIAIFISEFQNQSDRQLKMVWENSRNELIIQEII
jgi:hypothetical protein